MQPYEEVDVQSPSDDRPCSIIGLKVLPDGRLIVADADNECVKLFDTKHKLIDKLQLQGDQWNITLVGDDQVLVTVVGVRWAAGRQMHQLQFVIVSGHNLRLGHSFPMENIHYSSVYFEDQLFVVDSVDETIKILDMTGKILRTIDKSSDMPRALVVSPTNRVLYVSNLNDGTLKCMTLDGEVLTAFKGTWGFHLGLAVHPDDSVYVCNPTCVYHITSQCTHVETILDHGELHSAMLICINPSENILYVSDGKGSTVKVFSLGD